MYIKRDIKVERSEITTVTLDEVEVHTAIADYVKGRVWDAFDPADVVFRVKDGQVIGAHALAQRDLPPIA